jgi:hypothetical protein
MYKAWFAEAMSGKTAVPLISAMPANMAITVSGFFTDVNLLSIRFPLKG